MSDLQLTETQAAGIRKAVIWFKKCQEELEANKPLSQPIFRIFGFAGTGKTTILKYVMGELGVETMPRIPTGVSREERDEARYKIAVRASQVPMVLYMAFTGKAALVMTRKGTPASTIHSATYSVQEPTAEAIEEARKALGDLLAAPVPDGADGLLHRAMIRDRENQIKNMHRPSFVINPDSIIGEASLIVLDEVSMVGEDMAQDVMSFGKPILVLGDPGQLPPIKGEGAFTKPSDMPDVFLDEIHRQALDSPIIRLATMARRGEWIDFGRYSDTVWKVDKGRVSAVAYLRADQLLCGYNATRIGLNNSLRLQSGQKSYLPDEGAKIICLKNRQGDGLINGQFLNLNEFSDLKDLSFRARITTEDGVDTGKHQIYRGHFDDHIRLDKDRNERDYFKKKGMVECVWGYAITVHKSQGSQWQNVIVYDDGFGRGEDRNRWLYTGITRAESGLLILA